MILRGRMAERSSSALSATSRVPGQVVEGVEVDADGEGAGPDGALVVADRDHVARPASLTPGTMGLGAVTKLRRSRVVWKPTRSYSRSARMTLLRQGSLKKMSGGGRECAGKSPGAGQCPCCAA